jgi:glutaredoxin 3
MNDTLKTDPNMNMPKIIVYTKTGCPWGIQVLDFLKEKGLPFEDRNMTDNDNYRIESIEKTGQWKCPTIDIDGHMLPDSDAKQLDEYLKSIGL